MMQFFSDIFNPSMSFLLYATLVGLLASISFGIMGTFVVVKRISFIAGAISHCVLGGVGLGMYLNRVLDIFWITPQMGAMLMAIFSAIIIGLFNLYFKEREDTLIGAIWALGMAIGLVFIHFTPGYTDPMSYLFGSILMVGPKDLWTVIILDAVILGFVFVFFNKFVAICFDEEFARLRGVNTKIYYILLLVLIALAVVTLINVVGIVMIIALLTIPSGIASVFAKSIVQMIFFSIGLCLVTILLGLVLSYGLDVPSGPIIIIINSLFYFMVIFFMKKRVA